MGTEMGHIRGINATRDNLTTTHWSLACMGHEVCSFDTNMEMDTETDQESKRVKNQDLKVGATHSSNECGALSVFWARCGAVKSGATQSEGWTSFVFSWRLGAAHWSLGVRRTGLQIRFYV